MAAPHEVPHHQRQIPPFGRRLFGLCLFVSLTLAACGSDGSDETSAGAATDDAAETSDSGGTTSSTASSSDDASAESDDQDSASTEPTTTAPTEGSTTSAGDSSSTTSATTPDTTVQEDPTSTIDKSSVFTDPEDTKPSIAPPTTVSESSGDPLVDQVIGMSEAAAIDLVRSTGRKVRIERRDGEEFMLTQDFEPDRLNLTVVNGSVTSVRLG